MSVFDRQYQVWEGERTTPLARLLILPRYAFRDIFSSRLFTALFTASFGPTIVASLLIWVRNNVSLLERLGLRASEAGQLPTADGRAFLFMLFLQLWFAAILTFIQGPALVSPDLVNGALPLYLSRPVTRTQYVLGKFLVLAILLSLITWIPLSYLFFLQASLAGGSWLFENLRLLFGIVFGSLLAVAVLSIAALAISAYAKAKALARALAAGLLIIPAGFGEFLNEVLDTHWGRMLNVVAALESVAASLLGVPHRVELPLAGGLVSLVFVGVASLLLLNRRLRAFEVVR